MSLTPLPLVALGWATKPIPGGDIFLGRWQQYSRPHDLVEHFLFVLLLSPTHFIRALRKKGKYKVGSDTDDEKRNGLTILITFVVARFRKCRQNTHFCGWNHDVYESVVLSRPGPPS